MKVLKVDLQRPNANTISMATEVLKKGGLLIYPTDTAYGLGGNALHTSVIKKVYDVQRRVITKPTHVVIRNWQMINEIAYTSPLAFQIYQEFLPGPLSMVLKKGPNVPDILTGGLPTIGVRLPKCAVTLEISKRVDFPYTTPSANRTGGKTPYTITDVMSELDTDKVDLILDAGELTFQKPSTLLDLSIDQPKILREGPITKTQLEKTLHIKISN